MHLRSFRSKLLVAVSALAGLIIGSGILISLLFTQRYSSSLMEAARAQAENLAHAIALEAADKILINELVPLQKKLDYQMRSNPSVAYLFIIRDNEILAHTFPQGVPLGLIGANHVIEDDRGLAKRIRSTTGERYLDIAWPIFLGKAGVLRLGLSEKPYRQQVSGLWLQMSALTLAILLLALTASLLFIKRITWPITTLAEAAEKIDKGQLGVRVELDGTDEVATLASSFNNMVARIKEDAQHLEEKTRELDRAHRLTQSYFAIIQEIGTLPTLNHVGLYLIDKFRGILASNHMVFLIFNGNRDLLFTLSESGLNALKEPELAQTAMATLENLQKVTLTKKTVFKPPLVPDDFESARRLAIFPLHHQNQLFGALLVAFPRESLCRRKELEAVNLILNQTSGAIKRAASQQEEMHAIESHIENTAEFSGMVGKDPGMRVIYKLIEDIAPTDATVLIQGESGTGKELVARAIHEKSPRKQKRFIVINCSAYPATLLESEVFGHEKGAFTGAMRQKPGRFEQAHGGTVFLDEIGEISPSAQIKLLRVLQTHRFERLGGEHTIAVDVRVIAATNKDLLQEVKNGNFREDLFYRLNVIPIFLPPLTKRRNDIPMLAQHFLRRFTAEQGKDIQGFSSEAMRIMLDYHWPGNVRELENSIEHTSVLAKGERIEVSDLPSALRDAYPFDSARAPVRNILENERMLLKNVLDECAWNKKLAAERLGISRSTVYDKIRKFHITPPLTL